MISYDRRKQARTGGSNNTVYGSIHGICYIGQLVMYLVCIISYNNTLPGGRISEPISSETMEEGGHKQKQNGGFPKIDLVDILM